MDEKCECHIISGHKLHNDGSLSNTFTISYCPLHAAAPDMLATLKEVRESFHYNIDAGGPQIGVLSALELMPKIDAAIAAAEKKE